MFLLLVLVLSVISHQIVATKCGGREMFWFSQEGSLISSAIKTTKASSPPPCCWILGVALQDDEYRLLHGFVHARISHLTCG